MALWLSITTATLIGILLSKLKKKKKKKTKKVREANLIASGDRGL
jgi:hypothetical protein